MTPPSYTGCDVESLAHRQPQWQAAQYSTQYTGMARLLLWVCAGCRRRHGGDVTADEAQADLPRPASASATGCCRRRRRRTSSLSPWLHLATPGGTNARPCCLRSVMLPRARRRSRVRRRHRGVVPVVRRAAAAQPLALTAAERRRNVRRRICQQPHRRVHQCWWTVSSDAHAEETIGDKTDEAVARVTCCSIA